MGNSAKLKQTALVEAFNLRAAVELQLGNCAGADLCFTWLVYARLGASGMARREQRSLSHALSVSQVPLRYDRL